MKAIIWTAYGPPDVLALRDIPQPVPQDGEILIKIHAATVTAGDCEMRSLTVAPWLRLPLRAYIGLLKPTRVTILGQEMAGEVAAVGRDVTRFQPGDAVFAFPGFSLGGYAEYICLPADPQDGALAHKPVNMSYEQAACVPLGGLEALHFLRRAAIQPGESLLINGAGGSIGTIAVQLARLDGAEVTAVDSAPKLPMLQALGAEHVIDYTREDFTRSGRSYDIIFDIIGKSDYARSLAALNPGGRYLLGNPSLRDTLRARRAPGDNKQIIRGAAAQKTADLLYLKDLIEAGHLTTIIDRRYPLAQTAAAHRYVESGAKAGNVIITVA